ncbi:CBS domain-containing protein [uncultured Sphingomonas sp.]|uniref:CBS domain-containing protein n=1 Tax=uncultured Sphingomonas sp. TaxID=158754 RepID=UPI0035CA4FFC
MPPKELKTVADALAAGRSVNPVTVREFLSWFDAKRRGVSIVAHIREQLEELSLETLPDFEEPWLDGSVGFHRASAMAEGTAAPMPGAVPPQSANAPTTHEVGWAHRDAGYRLSRFQAANKKVVYIGPDASVSEVVTTMMLNDFSQLPVMVGERTVKGVVTWPEIAARFVLGKPGACARDFMVEATILDETASIFDAIRAIVERDFVLVRDREQRIAGIVTAADLSLQFRALSEPFLLLSEIETHVRNIIGQRYSSDELRAVRAPGSTHDVSTVADLTFGEYVFLLQDGSNWARLELKADRKAFCRQLEKVRGIRNLVMHFDPDGLVDEDLRTLQEFSSFLKRLDQIRS